MGRLVHTSLGSSYLIAHVLDCPPPPPHTALYCRTYYKAVCGGGRPWPAGLPGEKKLLAPRLPAHAERESFFIGTRFSNLYTSVDTPARGRVVVAMFDWLAHACMRHLLV